jgi:hypothetical protein
MPRVNVCSTSRGPNLSTHDNKARSRDTRELHDDASNRLATQNTAAVEIETAKDFHAEPKKRER